MDNIEEIIHVKRVGGSAYSIVDVEEIKNVELGIISSVGVVVDYVEQNQNIEGGSKIVKGASEVTSVDDVERVRIVEEGIVVVNDVGVAKRVRFVFEDLRSGDTDDDENTTSVDGTI
nr:FAR1 DNA binding domain-containing protein [Tanacetum cinerariifolium]